jgi:hypothetical protein
LMAIGVGKCVSVGTLFRWFFLLSSCAFRRAGDVMMQNIQ